MDEGVKLKQGVTIVSESAIEHSKAAEEYIEVSFPFDDGIWNLWIPIVYRRSGLYIQYPGEDKINLAKNDDTRNMLYDYLNKVGENIPQTKEKLDAWKEAQLTWWNTEKSNAKVTVDFFKGMVNATAEWVCTHCLAPDNTNPQRRIQEIKDIGYTVATKTSCRCEKCRKNRTHVMMLPIKRDGVGNGYEQWSPELRARIIKVLGIRDVYDEKKNNHVLPDHKFPEIRWDKNVKAKNPDDMSDEAIRDKFQLLTNQHNQEKREACRKCRLTGKRPYPFGVKYYSIGSEQWEGPEIGIKAEEGCKGCCWYDFADWRKALNKKLSEEL